MTIKFDEKGLVPAIIQDINTKSVLMMGYMNEEAMQKTIALQKVTFFSRSKNRLWTKGEESGNYLKFVALEKDCDGDALLIQAIPEGPTCHKGTNTCWGDKNPEILDYLEKTIDDRFENPDEKSYIADLKSQGINKIAQKVGEEAVEAVIEATRGDFQEDLFLNESADLLFHYLILLKAKGYALKDVKEILEKRRV